MDILFPWAWVFSSNVTYVYCLQRYTRDCQFNTYLLQNLFKYFNFCNMKTLGSDFCVPPVLRGTLQSSSPRSEEVLNCIVQCWIFNAVLVGATIQQAWQRMVNLGPRTAFFKCSPWHLICNFFNDVHLRNKNALDYCELALGLSISLKHPFMYFWDKIWASALGDA